MKIGLVIIGLSEQSMLPEEFLNTGLLLQEQRITVCTWVDGQYEDQVFVDADRLESMVVPELELTVKEIFAPNS